MSFCASFSGAAALNADEPREVRREKNCALREFQWKTVFHVADRQLLLSTGQTGYWPTGARPTWPEKQQASRRLQQPQLSSAHEAQRV